MTHFILSPGVSLGLGETAVLAAGLDRHGRRDVVTADMVLFEIPPADISTASGLYFLSRPLADAYDASALTGLLRREARIGLDGQVEELGSFAGREVPELVCYEVHGDFPESDFSYRPGTYGLILSAPAMALLEGFDLSGCDVEAFPAP